MRVGVLGKMCAGKTTLANALVKQGYTRMAFADKVKEIARELFGMTSKDRPLLQAIGQGMRNIRATVWIDYLLSKVEGDNIVIDDVRYENEVLALKEAGFIIIYLDVDRQTQKERIRKLYKDPETHLRGLTHASEQADTLRHLANLDIRLQSYEDIEKCIQRIKI